MTQHKFLALGDSYTIGEGVDQEVSWPFQLRRALKQKKVELAPPVVLARTGWTTEELESAIEEADLQGPFDLVTLMVGVNDQYRGYEVERFEIGFQRLLHQACGFSSRGAAGVLVLSIPDWGVTPFAMDRDLHKIAHEIDTFNRSAARRCESQQVTWVDVTSCSRAVGSQPHMLVADQLHPSRHQYEEWVEILWPIARQHILPGETP